MTNIVLLVKDRPRLTEQCLRTLYANTPQDQFNLTIVDDGSTVETKEMLDRLSRGKKIQEIHLYPSIGIVGWLRNVGASASERYFGRGDWLLFLDADTALFPNWLQKMTFVAQQTEGSVAVWGGCRHPFHGVNETIPVGGKFVEITDAVAGYSMLMRWKTFDDWGPFASNQKGIGASEDHALCRSIAADGGKVGYVHPPVLAHTGIVNTDGHPATGADSFRRVEGILYE